MTNETKKGQTVYVDTNLNLRVNTFNYANIRLQIERARN